MIQMPGQCFMIHYREAEQRKQINIWPLLLVSNKSLFFIQKKLLIFQKNQWNERTLMNVYKRSLKWDNKLCTFFLDLCRLSIYYFYLFLFYSRNSNRQFFFSLLIYIRILSICGIYCLIYFVCLFARFVSIFFSFFLLDNNSLPECSGCWYWLVMDITSKRSTGNKKFNNFYKFYKFNTFHHTSGRFRNFSSKCHHSSFRFGIYMDRFAVGNRCYCWRCTVWHSCW